MQINTELIKNIYEKLGDELSKDIFRSRLVFSLTHDSRVIHDIVKKNEKGKEFFEKLDGCVKEGDIVIFGAGTWGKDLYEITSEYPWKCFIDNSPKAEAYKDIPIVKADEFMREYEDEYIFISSRIYYKEMYEQLLREGVSDDKIINVGEILDYFAQEQYFDLEYLKPSKNKEVFLDVGSFDGMTSVNFSKWSKKDSLVIVFEPDSCNRKKCEKNLKDRHIEYVIIPKGAWSATEILHFKADSNGTSNISDTGEEMIEVTTIDQAIGSEQATFIKMDIEGAEAQALYGTRKTIENYKPKLAISIYHKPEDIWEIPEIILKYNSDYKLYLRHYSLTDMETVLYAISE